MSSPAKAGPGASDWYVYVARCADETLYTGIARDPEARITQHNAGRGAAYTRARRPVVLVYREPAADRGAALRREAAIKRMNAADKRRMIRTAG
jgi:putative endonuclease